MSAIRIVLVDTQHPGNIGASARAMKNMGLESLVLVRPRAPGDPEAAARAAGAADVLAHARIVATVDEAIAGCGPVLLATRIEDPALPTFIAYGHGDVVLGMEGRWANNRDPWKLSFEGERVYGRGVADNKGQTLVHVAALREIMKARGVPQSAPGQDLLIPTSVGD